MTRFHLELLPYPVCGFFSSIYIYPSALYHQAFEWIQSIVPGADEDTEIVMVAFHFDSEPEVCFKIHCVTMKSNRQEAEHALQQLHRSRPSGTLAEWVCQEESLAHLYEDQATANPASHYYHTDNVFLANEANVTRVLAESFLNLPPGKSFAFWYPMYPRSRRVVSNVALSVPSDHYFAVYTISESEEQATQSKIWVDEIMTRLKEHALGSYVGDCDLKLPHRWYWTDQIAQQIEAIRQKWDPSSIFCAGHQHDGTEL